ncbi:heterokaryon incompatibility protein-domain-containing protein [Phyllosticta citrichinensis]|uniref:Heterokaryon incompatibility protein-domain-containing protein n=1 Tax=Phyllosticta citrichinensis TaxID=1130410 RepID=A0ABR1Y551_9PEZI
MSDGNQDQIWIKWEHIRDRLAESQPVPPLDPTPPGFRLVDVEENKVIQAPRTPFTYICLSYVWGNLGENDVLATMVNICDLEKTDSLSGSVPATIRDAMTACRRLGQRYPWVDRLCILQDDDSPYGEKQVQIESMDEIHNHALATFIAITATNADSGLHGVSKPLETSGADWGRGFTRMYPWTSSEWKSRGWTYQEAIVSRRLIYFDNYDTVIEDKREDNSYWPRLQIPNSHGDYHHFDDYEQAVSDCIHIPNSGFPE